MGLRAEAIRNGTNVKAVVAGRDRDLNERGRTFLHLYVEHTLHGRSYRDLADGAGVYQGNLAKACTSIADLLDDSDELLAAAVRADPRVLDVDPEWRDRWQTLEAA